MTGDARPEGGTPRTSTRPLNTLGVRLFVYLAMAVLVFSAIYPFVQGWLA